MAFEIQAHRGNDELTLSRLLAACPSSVELDVGLANGELVVAHDTDLADATGLELADALAALRSVRVIVEAKCFPPVTPSPREFVHALQPYLGEIALCSFEERVLVEAQRLCPELETTFLFERPMRLETSAATIGPRRDLVTAELVDGAHALGLRVVPWTVNDAEEMAALIDLGVDGLVTDEPVLAHVVLHGQRSEAVA
ncbi:MAG TPA: glycerophosphodiester phosphodiesterase family protein [Gaiellaceae bacterium]